MKVRLQYLQAILFIMIYVVRSPKKLVKNIDFFKEFTLVEEKYQAYMEFIYNN